MNARYLMPIADTCHMPPPNQYCCGRVSVKHGALIVVLSWSILLLFELAYLGIIRHNPASISTQTIVVFTQLIVVLCLLYGIYSLKESYFIPFIVMELITICIWVTVIIIGIWAIMSPQSAAAQFVDETARIINQPFNKYYHRLLIDCRTTALIFIIEGVLMIFAQLWFLWIVTKCSQYFRHLRRYIQDKSLIYNYPFDQTIMHNSWQQE